MIVSTIKQGLESGVLAVGSIIQCRLSGNREFDEKPPFHGIVVGIGALNDFHEILVARDDRQSGGGPNGEWRIFSGNSHPVVIYEPGEEVTDDPWAYCIEHDTWRISTSSCSFCASNIRSIPATRQEIVLMKKMLATNKLGRVPARKGGGRGK